MNLTEKEISVVKDYQVLVGNTIMEIIRAHNNKIKRADLLDELFSRGLLTHFKKREDADRAMRDICAKIVPVCSSNDGYYIPITREEVLAFKSYMRKKAYPLFARWDFIAQSYPELLEPEQMKLFEGA